MLSAGPRPTSSAAAAFWYPFKAGSYDRSIGEMTYMVFRALARDVPESGVRQQRAVEYFPGVGYVSRFRSSCWWQYLPGIDLELAEDRNITLGEHALSQAVQFNTYVIDMGPYLDFLDAWFEDKDGVKIERLLSSIEDAFADEFDVVVDCAGLGALDLLGPEIESRGCQGSNKEGEGMKALHGQVLRLRGQSYPHLVLAHEGAFDANPFYIVPRANDVIVGGSSTLLLPYRKGECLRPRGAIPDQDKRIREWCGQVAPELDLEQAQVLTGVRPFRDPIRIDYDPSFHQQQIVHNYGHGGSGVTLSWGSAQRVLELIRHYIQGTNQVTFPTSYPRA